MLYPFNVQKQNICNLIRKPEAYANDEKTVNSYSPIILLINKYTPKSFRCFTCIPRGSPTWTVGSELTDREGTDSKESIIFSLIQCIK